MRFATYSSILYLSGIEFSIRVNKGRETDLSCRRCIQELKYMMDQFNGKVQERLQLDDDDDDEVKCNRRQAILQR